MLTWFIIDLFVYNLSSKTCLIVSVNIARRCTGSSSSCTGSDGCNCCSSYIVIVILYHPHGHRLLMV